MQYLEGYDGREQTRVKHSILEKYLARVAYNILSFGDEFVYVDGFSGPWETSDVEFGDSSVKIALSQLRKVKEGCGSTKSIRCIFNDSNPQAYSNLEKIRCSETEIHMEVMCKEFEQAVPFLVKSIGSSFSLSFIDPTGFSGFGLRQIQPLISKRNSEVIINLMFDFINRFIDHPNPLIVKQCDDLFGGPDWRTIFKNLQAQGQLREEAILSTYLQKLKEIGKYKYVTSTRVLKPYSDRTYFHLVYGTNHWKGVLEFREVEKRTVPVQDGVRLEARRRQTAIRTGMTDLFSESEPKNASIFTRDERTSAIGLAQTQMVEILKTNTPIPYEELVGIILQRPLIWQSDVKEWLKELKKGGSVSISGMAPNQQVPKPTNKISWIGN